jgi:peptidoglycan hydrolase CwlO-like protein
MKDHIEQQAKYNDTMQKIQMLQSPNPNDLQNKINNLSQMVQELTLENTQLKDKINYLESKIKQIVSEQIKNKMNNNTSTN